MQSARGTRLLTHPVITLLAGVVLLGALVIAVTADVSRSASIPIEVRGAECYRIVYADPIGGASAEYFPARIILLPGIDSGAVRLEGSSVRGGWWMFAESSTWRAIGRDSIALDLTNGITHIDVRAGRSAGRLAGRATYRANLAAPVSPPAMRFVGELEPITPALRSISYDLRDDRTGEVSCASVRTAAATI